MAIVEYCIQYLTVHVYNTGRKMNFPISPVCKKLEISLTVLHHACNPVEDRAKCQICMTFGSILRIGGEQSMKCQISCYRRYRKFHFRPVQLRREKEQGWQNSKWGDILEGQLVNFRASKIVIYICMYLHAS